jgi:hypothetical protein
MGMSDMGDVVVSIEQASPVLVYEPHSLAFVEANRCVVTEDEGRAQPGPPQGECLLE